MCAIKETVEDLKELVDAVRDEDIGKIVEHYSAILSRVADLAKRMEVERTNDLR